MGMVERATRAVLIERGSRWEDCPDWMREIVMGEMRIAIQSIRKLTGLMLRAMMDAAYGDGDRSMCGAYRAAIDVILSEREL